MVVHLTSEHFTSAYDTQHAPAALSKIIDNLLLGCSNCSIGSYLYKSTEANNSATYVAHIKGCIEPDAVAHLGSRSQWRYCSVHAHAS